MPRFDLLTIGAKYLFFYLLYSLSIQTAIPSFIEIQKFRIKKLVKNQEKVIYINNYLNDNLKFTYSFYQIFFK